MSAIESAEHATKLLKVYDLFLGLWESEHGPDPRGLARQIAVVALVTRRQLGLNAYDALPLSVLAFRGSVKVTAGAFRKSHSHARALLDYGAIKGVPLWDAVMAIDAEGDELLARVDALVQQLNLPQALAARAEHFGGARGGRPTARVRPQVLEAVAGLMAKAGRGDTAATQEIAAIVELIGQRAG